MANFFRTALSADHDSFGKGATEMERLVELQKKNEAIREIENLKNIGLVEDIPKLDIKEAPDLRTPIPRPYGTSTLPDFTAPHKLGLASPATTEAIQTAENYAKSQKDRAKGEYAGLFFEYGIPGFDRPNIMRDKDGDRISWFDYNVLGHRPWDKERGGYYEAPDAASDRFWKPKSRYSTQMDTKSTPWGMAKTLDDYRTGKEAMVTSADAAIGGPKGTIDPIIENIAIMQGTEDRAGTDPYKKLAVDDVGETGVKKTSAELAVEDYLKKVGYKDANLLDKMFGKGSIADGTYRDLQNKALKSVADRDLSDKQNIDLAELYTKDPIAAGQDLDNITRQRKILQEALNIDIQTSNIYRKYGQIADWERTKATVTAGKLALAEHDNKIIYHQAMKGLMELTQGNTTRLNAALTQYVGEDIQVIIRDDGLIDIEYSGRLSKGNTGLTPKEAHAHLRPKFDSKYRTQQADLVRKQAEILFETQAEITVELAKAREAFKLKNLEGAFNILAEKIKAGKLDVRFNSNTGETYVLKDGKLSVVKDAKDVNNEDIIILKPLGGIGNYSKDAYNAAVTGG